MIENYVLAKKIVSKRFSKNNEFYPMFVLALYGILTEFKNTEKIVNDIFERLLIIIGNKPIKDLMIENKFDIDYIYGFEQNEDLENQCQSHAISKGRIEYIFTNNNFVKLENDPFVICSTYYNNSWAHLLISFMHEFSHLVKNEIKNTYTLKGKDYIGYGLRNGMSFYELKYYPKDEMFSENVVYEMIDEVINCSQTTDAAKAIKEIESIIPDKSILNFLRKLDKEDLEDNGYEDALNEFKPLWKNHTFRDLINENIVDGRINIIVQEFDKICGKNSFNKFDEYLMKIDEMAYYNLFNSYEMNNAKKEIMKMIILFNKKTKSFEKRK